MHVNSSPSAQFSHCLLPQPLAPLWVLQGQGGGKELLPHQFLFPKNIFLDHLNEEEVGTKTCIPCTYSLLSTSAPYWGFSCRTLAGEKPGWSSYAYSKGMKCVCPIISPFPRYPPPSGTASVEVTNDPEHPWEYTAGHRVPAWAQRQEQYPGRLANSRAARLCFVLTKPLAAPSKQSRLTKKCKQHYAQEVLKNAFHFQKGKDLGSGLRWISTLTFYLERPLVFEDSLIFEWNCFGWSLSA